MAKFKKFLGTVWKWTWECIKRSIIPLITYITVSILIFMLTNEGQEWKDGLTTGRAWLCFGLAFAAVAYNGVTAFTAGGNGYEALVTGNIKRTVEGEELKMSSHKEQKEYRVWKGFAIGGVVGLITLIVALTWGANQAAINEILAKGKEASASEGLRLKVFADMFLWGWAVLPFLFLNASGIYVSYYLILLYALLSVLVSGIFYIVGAYHRRNKKLALQEAELKQREEKEKPKKVNYGGLPGTQPKRRK